MTSSRTNEMDIVRPLLFGPTHFDAFVDFDDLDDFLREGAVQFEFSFDDFVAFDFLDNFVDFVLVVTIAFLGVRHFSSEQSFGTRIIKLLTQSCSSSKI